MAGYIITRSSNFTPFTYDEMVKPIEQFTQAHNEAAQNYGELISNTSSLQNYINPDTDKEANELYNNYLNKLNTLQENLWNKGYNAGTVRDLTAARAGYASDITRIAKAIETRQNRSKEYWDTLHKNPDMVAGTDPGKDSLDLYMKNDNYGQNWYSYSGNAFANEVAADIDARANELLRTPEILKNPRIAGYIQEKRQVGFTNDEINKAGTAAWNLLNGNASDYNNLDDITRIAADVLVNRMQSTGATTGADGNLTPEAYRRLFDYGLMGASRGIKAPEIKDYDDKNWEFQRQMALAYAKHSGNSQKGSGSGYTIDPTTPQILSEGTSKKEEELSKIYNSDVFKDGPVNINLPDGRTVPVSSVNEMSSLMYDTPERQFVREHFGGIDLGLDPQNWFGTSDSRQQFIVEQDGKQIVFNTGKLKAKDAKRLGITANNPVAIRQIVNGKPVLNESYTKEFNRNLAKYQNHVEDIERLNRRTLRKNNIVITPKEEKKLETKYNLDSRLSSSDIPFAVAAKELISNSSPTVIVDSSEPMSSIRKDYLNNIVSSFKQGMTYSGEKESDKSQAPYAFYPVSEEGNRFAKKGTTKLSDVFVLDNSGNPKDGSLLSIEPYPSDLALGMVRITTDKGVFGVKSAMLGSLMGNTLNNPQFKSVLGTLMLPFTAPDKVLVEAADTPVQIFDDYNRPIVVTMGDIIRNKDIQRMYYSGVLKYINNNIAHPRELKAQQHITVTGNTSSKPNSYNPFIQ